MQLDANFVLEVKVNEVIGEGSATWGFENDGSITFPDDTVQTTAWTGILPDPTYIGSDEIGFATPAPLNLNNSAASTLLTQLNLINTGGGAGSGSAIDFWTYTSINDVPEVRLGAVDDGDYSADFSIALKGTGNSGNNGLTTIWQFGTDGVLTLPGNTFAVNYANGTPVTIGGGSASTGNITFDQSTITTDQSNTYINLNSFGAGELSLGSNDATDVVIVTDSSNEWTFGADGNLTIPGSSGGLIKTVANASIGIAAMDNGTDNPAQLMSWNINAANPNTIISAYQGNALIQTDVNSTAKTWTFDAAGNLTLPSGGRIIVSGGIVASGASPAPTLSGFSSVSAQTLSATGNVTVGNLTTGGHVAATGNITGNYFIGNGSQLTGISSGVQSSIANGTSNVNISTANGNVTVTANSTQTWSFDNTGNLTLPAGGDILNSNGVSVLGSPLITTVELAGEPLVINNVAGANTIYVKSASGYTGSDTHTINVLNRNVDGLRTLIVNNSALCNVIVGFADGVNITVAATDRVDVVYIDNTIIVISQFLLDLQTAYS
jgi:hypothetical protein